jgi:integrase
MIKLPVIYQRPDRPNYYLRWTDPVTHRRVVKSFHTRPLADHWRKILYYKLNSDVFIGTINNQLSKAIDEYLHKYDLKNLSHSSEKEASNTLQMFLAFAGDVGTKSIRQAHFEAFILKRKPDISPHTLNKDIRNLKAFIAWSKKNRYIDTNIEIDKVKTVATIKKSLTVEQIQELFLKCPSKAWRCRILLSLVTGLRAGDIDRLEKNSLDLKTLRIDTESLKTSKVFIGRPIPESAKEELTSYVNSLPADQVKLFADVNIRKTWYAIKGETKITRQQLRVTFSTLMQKIGSIGSAQELLEHSSSKTTNEFYSDHELINRWKVNQLQVSEWLKKGQTT